MMIRLKIVCIPCLKKCAAAFCYQWTLITEVGYTRVIKVTAISGYSVVFVVVCLLVSQSSTVNSSTTFFCLFAFVFVSICACLTFFLTFILFNFYSNYFWKQNVYTYMALFGISGTCQKVKLHASTLR